MTDIFVSHSAMDTQCAEQVRQGLQTKGYTAWQTPASMQMSDLLSPRTMQTAIVGSAAFILLWSSSASRSEHVERHLFFAQRLRKPIIPVLLDKEPLPNTLLTIPPLSTQASCTDIVVLLLQQPLLPPFDSIDPLIVLWERAAHDLVRERKEAIDQAANMLVQSLYREAVLALLEYLVHNDLMNGVREKAQEVMDADTKRQMSAPVKPFFKPEDSRHIFGVRCKNGHVTYFDKRRVCKMPTSTFHRVVRNTEANLDELDLECGTCHEPVTMRVDCEGYE